MLKSTVAIGEAKPVKIRYPVTNATRTPPLFETPYRPPQVSWWELRDGEWLKMKHRSDDASGAARRLTALTDRLAGGIAVGGKV